MIDETGARRQESLREHPALKAARDFNRTLKGVVKNVKCRDTNRAKQTLVDLTLYGGYPDIHNVPLATGKFNQGNGEDWSPQAGDLVLVTFIDGKWIEPIVIGEAFLPQEGDDAIQPTTAELPPRSRRYHLRCNKTSLKIDKDGNRTTIIEGNEDVTVTTGDITITATAGKCTVHIKGKTAWTSEATIELDGTNGTGTKGVVQGDCFCPLLKAPHAHISASVKASK